MAHEPLPLRFGACFGWLHAAGGEVARAPVVLCPPFGVEALASHLALRQLAQDLAAQGHAVLRFDPPGCGLSDETGAETDLFAAGLASVEHAIDALKAATGHARVILLGLRLGATLTALAAQGREDLAGLVLLGAIRSGRRHARELTALSQMQGPAGEAEGGIAVHGFVLGERDLAGLGRLDLAALPPSPCPTLLLTPPETEAALESGGEHAPFAGLAELIENPTQACVPEAAFARVLAWCAALPPQSATRAPATPAPAVFALPEGGQRRALRFGPEGRLWGMMFEPPDSSGKPAVIIANAGRNPATGWGRQNLTLARMLAAQGHRVLLCDLGGIGDSERAPGARGEVLYAPEQGDDLMAALACLEQAGADRVFLIGACSGAYAALAAARQSASVVGVALVNQMRFHWTPGESLDVAAAQASFRTTEGYRKRLFQRETWARLLRGDINVAGIAGALARRAGGALLRRVQGVARSGDSPQAEALGWFAALAARGVRVLVIHTPEDPSLENLKAYFGAEGKTLRALAGNTFHLVEGGDHSLSRPASQAQLHALLCEALTGLAQGVPVSGKVAPRQ